MNEYKATSRRLLQHNSLSEAAAAVCYELTVLQLIMRPFITSAIGAAIRHTTN